MHIALDKVVSQIWTEGPNWLWLDELLTFYDEKSEEIIKFIDSEGYVYTGLLIFLEQLLREQYGIDGIRDKITTQFLPEQVVIPDNYLRGITLRDYQKRLASKGLILNRGIFELATGAGKTEIATTLLQWLFSQGYATKAVVVTPTQYLMEQFYHRLLARIDREYFNARARPTIIREEGEEENQQEEAKGEVQQFVGRLGEGYQETDRAVVVGVSDSWYSGIKSSKPDVLAVLQEAQVFIADEAHHLRSPTWTAVAKTCQAQFRYGLTPAACEDPWQPDPADYSVVGLTGPVIAHVPAHYLASRGYLATQFVSMLEVYHPRVDGFSEWSAKYRHAVVRHEARNQLVVRVSEQMYNANRKVLILVSQLEHGWRLVWSLKQLGVFALFSRGGRKVDSIVAGNWQTDTWSMEQLAGFLNSQQQFVLVGSTVMDEGVDIPIIDTVVMAAGMKKYRRILQRLGRGMRPKPGENMVYTFDLWDAHCGTLLRHSERRLATYQYEQHPIYGGLDPVRQHLFLPFDVSRPIPWADFPGGPRPLGERPRSEGKATSR